MTQCFKVAVSVNLVEKGGIITVRDDVDLIDV